MSIYDGGEALLVPCDCGAPWCILHGCHAYECPCEPEDEDPWSDPEVQELIEVADGGL